MEYEKIEPDVWKFENPDDTFEGVLVEKRSDIGGYGSNAYMVENENGQFIVWGCAVLDDRMKFVQPGDQIKIVFKGVQKNKRGQDTKMFDVYKKKETSNIKEEQVQA